MIMNMGAPLSFATTVSDAQRQLQDALRAGMRSPQQPMPMAPQPQMPQPQQAMQPQMPQPTPQMAPQGMPQMAPQGLGSAMGSPQMGAPARFAKGGFAKGDFAVKKPATLPLGVRDAVKNPDGSTSTVRTISIGTDEGEVLIPTVIGGRVVSDEEAIQHYERTGEHLGVFNSPEEATRYAKKLSGEHAAEIKPKGFARGGGAWTRKEGKNPEGGLNAKGRASLKAQGQDIKPPVSAKQAKKSPKSAARRKSFCARSAGQAKMFPNAARDPNSRLNKARRKWDC